jgi:predicted house-cleaning noncanonical NTP pyrophosphatase (MazG superfamily)
MAEFELNKLVRDKIPDIMIAEDQTPRTILLVGPDRVRALIHKIIEEAHEALDALDTVENDETLKKEIVDMIVCKEALVAYLGISDQDIETIRTKIASQKGEYDNGVFISTVVVDESSEWAAYYRREPGRFKEV